jgi:hypothetical protein
MSRGLSNLAGEPKKVRLGGGEVLGRISRICLFRGWGGGPPGGEAGGILRHHQERPFLPDVLQAGREGSGTLIPESEPFARRAEGLAWKAEHVDMDPGDGSHVPLAAVLVETHVLAIHLVDEPADVRVALGHESMLVGNGQELERQAFCQQASAI